jgi:hypothetical protein
MKFEKEIRILAGRIPCQLCQIKGGHNIDQDGGCRHRPVIDSDENAVEVLDRLTRAVKSYGNG